LACGVQVFGNFIGIQGCCGIAQTLSTLGTGREITLYGIHNFSASAVANGHVHFYAVISKRLEIAQLCRKPIWQKI
jgi:hypothetical protein